MAPEHPECPDRLYAINDQLISSGIESVMQFKDALPAQPSYLKLAHDADFVHKVIEQAPAEGHIWLDDDTLMMPHSLSAALHAAGAGKLGIDLLLGQQVKRVFCAVRPPGHHAAYAKSAGFCIFNNIALAAKYALTHQQINRVAIVDFDVHHGDGTEDIVKQDPNILFCSSFQHPFYPFTGDKTQGANILNIPIEQGTKGKDYRQLVAPWFARLDSFKPDLLLISAGFDAHAEDDLAHLRLVEADYEWITSKLVEIANKHCEGRILSMLEGGYALSALARSVVSHLKALST